MKDIFKRQTLPGPTTASNVQSDDAGLHAATRLSMCEQELKMNIDDSQ